MLITSNSRCLWRPKAPLMSVAVRQPSFVPFGAMEHKVRTSKDACHHANRLLGLRVERALGASTFVSAITRAAAASVTQKNKGAVEICTKRLIDAQAAAAACTRPRSCEREGARRWRPLEVLCWPNYRKRHYKQDDSLCRPRLVISAICCHGSTLFEAGRAIWSVGTMIFLH